MQEQEYDSKQIFIRTEKWEFGEALFTSDMLQVLSAINGEKMLGKIAEELNLSLTDVCVVVNQLEALNVIVIEHDKHAHHTALFSGPAGDESLTANNHF